MFHLVGVFEGDKKTTMATLGITWRNKKTSTAATVSYRIVVPHDLRLCSLFRLLCASRTATPSLRNRQRHAGTANDITVNDITHPSTALAKKLSHVVILSYASRAERKTKLF